MKIKRFEKFESRKTGEQIRVKSVLGFGDVALIATIDSDGRSIRGSDRMVLVDSIRRKYRRTLA